MELIKKFIEKYYETITFIDIVLIIFSIGFIKNSIINGVVIFLLFLLLAFMPEKAFEDSENTKK